MKKTENRWVDLIIDFTTDYIEGNLDRDEREAFEAYLERHPEEKKRVRKAISGRRALTMLSEQKIKASEDFEAKLALNIAVGQKEEMVS